MELTIPTTNFEIPPPDEAFPRRPATLPRSNTFGENSPRSAPHAPDTSLPNDDAQEDGVSPSYHELCADYSLYTYTHTPHRRRRSSSGYDSETTAGTLFECDGGMGGARAGAPAQQDGDEEQHKQEHDDQVEEEEGEGTGNGDGEQQNNTLEEGTARVAQLVAPGAVSMVDIRRQTSCSLKSSRSVRDVASLPDLAWAHSLTTGGGRSAAAAAASVPGSVVSSPGARQAGPVVRPAGASVDGEGKERKKKQETPTKKKGVMRSLVTKKTVREWCERGMAGAGPGGFGPYAGMC